MFLALLPFLGLSILVYAFYVHLPELTRREALLYAASILGGALVLAVEVLSAFQLLDLYPLLIFWLLVILAGVIFMWRGYQKRRDWEINNIKKFFVIELIFLFMILFISIATFIISIIAPPNNWDSLTYHMSRVAHWIQNKTVAHYPTTMPRQNFFPPGSEYIITNLQILSGTDRFACLVQWLAMVGCLIGVSVITMYLNGDRIVQIFSSLITVCIPMGILQSTSTQNDYLEAFWMVCFMSFLLRDKIPSYITTVALGCSLGLGVLTKGTGYGYFLPMVLWLLYRMRPIDRQRLLKIMVLFFIAFIINAGYYARNLRTVGFPLGDRKLLSEHANEAITAEIIFSNIVRNIGLHLGTPIKEFNKWEETQIYNLHRLLGIDIKDKRSTFGGDEFHIPVSIHEDTAGNFLHFLFIMFAAVIFIFINRKNKFLAQYFWIISFMFLIFNITVKWMPFNSRLQLPMFVLFSPFIAVVLSDLPYRGFVMIFIAICVFAFAMPYVFRNNTRRLISSKKATIFNTPRIAQYFINDTTRRTDYIEAVDYIKETTCKDIGLIIPDDYWEYPFWVLLKGGNNKINRIEHVFIKGKFLSHVNRYPLGDFNPCMVIAVGHSLDSHIVLTNGVRYYKVFSKGTVQVYKHER